MYIGTTSAVRPNTGLAADAPHTRTGATTCTGRPCRYGEALEGGGGAAGTSCGTSCIAADWSRFRPSTGCVRPGCGRAAFAPEKAEATSLTAAVGHEAARCCPFYLVVADETSQSEKAVRGKDGRPRHRRSRARPRRHRDEL